MQNTPNYPNSIKRRTDVTSPLQWIDVDNNFQFPNAWKSSKSYSQGMQVLWNDYLGEPFNPHGEMAYWICTSNHLSSNSNAPGNGLVWEKIAGLNADYLHGYSASDFITVDGGTVTGEMNFNGIVNINTEIIIPSNNLHITSPNDEICYISYDSANDSNGNTTINFRSIGNPVNVAYLTDLNDYFTLYGNSTVYGTPTFSAGFTASGATFSGPVIAESTLRVSSTNLHIISDSNEICHISYDDAEDQNGNTTINFRSIGDFRDVAYTTDLNDYFTLYGNSTVYGTPTFSAGFTASGATFTGNTVAPTVGTTDSSSKVATTSYVQSNKLLSINPQAGATYSLQLSDNANLVRFSSSSAITLTIPQGTTLPIGYNTTIEQFGTGKITFVGATGTTVNSFLSLTSLNAQYSGAALVKTGVDAWWLYGQLTS